MRSRKSERVDDKTETGLAGEYYVLAQLAHRGLVGTLTLSHTKAVDILVMEPVTGGLLRIEVKTTKRKPGRNLLFGKKPFIQWPMSIKHESIAARDLFYCFVALGPPEQRPRFFIVPSAVVARYVRAEHQKWLKVKKLKVGVSPLRIFRQAAAGTRYEDAWELLLAAAKRRAAQRQTVA